MPRPKQKISIFSLAEEFAVSAPTISKALSNSVEVSAALRGRVRARAEELGFRPNRPRRRTYNLCVVVDLADDELFNLSGFRRAAVEGIYEFCSDRQAEFSLLGQSAKKLQDCDLSKELLIRNADGCVVIGAEPDRSYFTNLDSNGMAYACVYDGPPERTVTVDNAAAGRLALEHLAGLGHRRLAVARQIGTRVASNARFMAFVQQGAHRGLTHETIAEILPDSNDASYDHGRDILRAWSRHRTWTALFCITKNVALGVLSEAALLGIRIPQELSVLTCDDLATCSEAAPPLSVVDIPNHRAGYFAAETAWSQITGNTNGTPKPLCLPVERVIHRASTAPPPTA